MDQSPIYNSLEDEDLVTHARDGDAAAYDELVTRYRGKIYSVVYGMVRNEEDAWDLAQDGFLKAWKNLENFRGQSKFYTWLYRIVTNMTIDWLRRKKNQPAAEFDDTVRSADFEPGAATAPKSAVNPRKAAQHGELGGRIEEAIESLSPAHKAVVTLHMIEGFQYNEIAEMLDISLGTVMSRLFYARKKLQHALQDIYEDL